jgi:hypothetical protein
MIYFSVGFNYLVLSKASTFNLNDDSATCKRIQLFGLDLERTILIVGEVLVGANKMTQELSLSKTLQSSKR